jgi:hypothetical protein
MFITSFWYVGRKKINGTAIMIQKKGRKKRVVTTFFSLRSYASDDTTSLRIHAECWDNHQHGNRICINNYDDWSLGPVTNRLLKLFNAT